MTGCRVLKAVESKEWAGLQPDRVFEPRRVPFSPAAKVWVDDVRSRMVVLERRKRRRREVDQAAFDRASTALVADLAAVALSDPEKWTRVELSKQRLAPATRRAEFMTESFPGVIALLADERLGLVELRTAPAGTRHGLQSTARALPALVDELRAAGLDAGDFCRAGSRKRSSGPAVELRGPKVPIWDCGQWTRRGPKVALPDSAEVHLLTQEMDELNAWIATAALDFVAEPAGDLDLMDRHLKRIFNDGSFSKGGRLYGGFWQQMSADDRLTHIVWGDDSHSEDTASLDFGQSSIRMAYAEVGAEPPNGDLYELALGTRSWSNERDGIKAVMNALLSSDVDLSRFPKGTKRLFPPGTKFSRVLKDIELHHRGIAELFGTGRGLDVMYRESHVLVRVLSRLRCLGVHALPIHDGILVAEGHSEVAKSVMEEEFLAVTMAKAEVTVETALTKGLSFGYRCEG